MTKFLSQFEMNAEMEISKNQWRSTGGKCVSRYDTVNSFQTLNYVTVSPLTSIVCRRTL